MTGADEQVQKRFERWLVPKLGFGNEGRPSVFPAVENTFVFAASMLTVFAALRIAYGERMAFAEHARQYRATSILFKHAHNRLKDGDLTEEEVNLFRELGKEALAENGDWLLLHRDRPLEVVVP